MSEYNVASRYAKALIDLAREQNALEAVHQDMVAVIAVMKESSELRAVMNNPIIKLDKKQNILEEIFGEKINRSVAAFFAIMVRKGRGGIIYATALEFIESYNREYNIVKAKVESAAPLSEEHIKVIEGLIEKETRGQVILEKTVNPDLIGGFVITIGDRQVDASIAKKLNKLEEHFKTQVI